MRKRLNLLILEDSKDDAALLVLEMKKAGFEPVHERVDTREGLDSALEKQTWDIVISDHSMPHFSAIMAMEILRQKELDIPVIVLSGTIGEADAIAAMKAGASDYIMKGQTARLLPAIERELREAQSRRDKRAAEQNLIQAQKMESIGKLAGGVAHDFNNVLTAIMGYANILAEGPSSTWSEDIDQIRKASERAASLTRQLLAFSRRQVLQPRVIDLNAEILDLEKMLWRILGEDIKWDTRLSRELWHVKVDQGQIQQVIMNLAVNARDAMPKGGPLTMATENINIQSSPRNLGFTIRPGEYVVLSVADSGVGMDESTKARIFEPFFTTKEKGKGTGLGLSTVYGVVKQSGGFITVDSELGKGATFKIYLPRAVEKLAAKGGEYVPPKSWTGSESILVVDDDESIRGLMQRILRGNGYAVSVADAAEDAVESSQEKSPPDLLITDVVLPGINGIDLAKQMSARLPNLKTIFVSGYLDREIGNFSLNTDIQFLQKPFDATALLKIVRETLDVKIK